MQTQTPYCLPAIAHRTVLATASLFANNRWFDIAVSLKAKFKWTIPEEILRLFVFFLS